CWRPTRSADFNRLLHEVPAGTRTTDGVLPGVDESLSGQRQFMLQQDPPTHTRLRRLVSRAFTPRAIAALRGNVQRIVDECLDRVAPRGEMDVIADLALPVPATVICEMLGVPVGDRDRFTAWTAQAIGLLIAGFETTIGLIGNGVRALLEHPAELAKLRARPELAERAVEECLRYDGPIILTARVLHADVAFDGTTIPCNAKVWG